MSLSFSFLPLLAEWPREELVSRMNAARPDDVRRALAKDRLGVEDLPVLLSPAAASPDLLETAARRARNESLRHFGRAVQLFTPLYISDHCTNQCRYCGFNARNKRERRHLSIPEAVREAEAIAASGLRHVLLLTGDARRMAPPEYIAETAKALRPLMASVCVEVYAMSREEYSLLAAGGVDGMTIFQETYDREMYAALHPAGPKRNFSFRLEAPGRAAAAGMRSIGIGALLGLNEWRCDAFHTALHAHSLQRAYPSVECSVSVPRMRPCSTSFSAPHPVTDRDMAQYISALRCFMPRLGITLSTRENAKMRDNLLPLGISRMSAGVSTAVGTRAGGKTEEGQVETADTRGVAELGADLARMGYQAVLKDWEDPAPDETRFPAPPGTATFSSAGAHPPHVW
jgi:2-iminoacetate synthase